MKPIIEKSIIRIKRNGNLSRVIGEVKRKFHDGRQLVSFLTDMQDTDFRDRRLLELLRFFLVFGTDVDDDEFLNWAACVAAWRASSSVRTTKQKTNKKIVCSDKTLVLERTIDCTHDSSRAR